MEPRTARILIAEDQASLRKMMAVALEIDGHQVDAAENGQVALDCISRQHYDLLVTDWLMPQMDGQSLIRKTRQIEGCARLPVVVLSCLQEPEDARLHAAELQIDTWLRKPCRISEIQRAVKDALTREYLETGE